MRREDKSTLKDIHYVKLVPVGGIDPGVPFSEQAREEQTLLLNQCLNGYPQGVIIGKDVSIGRYQIKEHELIMEKVTYHVGFSRKPAWEIEDKG